MRVAGSSALAVMAAGFDLRMMGPAALSRAKSDGGVSLSAAAPNLVSFVGRFVVNDARSIGRSAAATLKQANAAMPTHDSVAA
jgi:hypothetical protein